MKSESLLKLLVLTLLFCPVPSAQGDSIEVTPEMVTRQDDRKERFDADGMWADPMNEIGRSLPLITSLMHLTSNSMSAHSALDVALENVQLSGGARFSPTRAARSIDMIRDVEMKRRDALESTPLYVGQSASRQRIVADADGDGSRVHALLAEAHSRITSANNGGGAGNWWAASGFSGTSTGGSAFAGGGLPGGAEKGRKHGRISRALSIDQGVVMPLPAPLTMGLIGLVGVAIARWRKLF